MTACAPHITNQVFRRNAARNCDHRGFIENGVFVSCATQHAADRGEVETDNLMEMFHVHLLVWYMRTAGEFSEFLRSMITCVGGLKKMM